MTLDREAQQALVEVVEIKLDAGAPLPSLGKHVPALMELVEAQAQRIARKDETLRDTRHYLTLFMGAPKDWPLDTIDAIRAIDAALAESDIPKEK